MLVGVIFNGEWLDIVLPSNKVEVVIIDILARKNRTTREQAKMLFKQCNQQELEKKFEKEIKKEFASYIKNEVGGWEKYEKKLEKWKMGKK